MEKYLVSNEKKSPPHLPYKFSEIQPNTAKMLNSDFFTSPADHIATMLFCDIFPNAFSEDHINDFFPPLIEGKLNISMKIQYFTYSSFLKRKRAHGRNSEISKFASKP